MVKRWFGDDKGAKGAENFLLDITSRLFDVNDEVTLESCTISHWQIRRKDKVLIDIWPTTRKFRVHDAPQGSPAATGSAEDVLDVLSWLFSKRSERTKGAWQ